MKKRFALVLSAVLVAAAAGCSKEETASKPGAGGSGAAESVAKIPILPGYKYYIGGPTLKRDPYGHYRISKFNGEVEQPPSRGMIFGVKIEGNQLDYRVWGNGKLLAVHRGIMRDGLYWQEYAETYRDGKLVARENTTNDDSIKRSKQVTEDIDPETGEVIRTKEASISYYPPAKLPDDEDEAEDAGTATSKPLEGELKRIPPEAPGQDSVTSEPLQGDLKRVTPEEAAKEAAPAAPAKPGK